MEEYLPCPLYLNFYVHIFSNLQLVKDKCLLQFNVNTENALLTFYSWLYFQPMGTFGCSLISIISHASVRMRGVHILKQSH